MSNHCKNWDDDVFNVIQINLTERQKNVQS